ncbi:BMP family lipoprotein [Desulfovibrio oxyclinae]|uniref:BMP family lipoprotein n=1 Tax=Desulfovibrio oxyclinae TaxID=63560 RepID=UPI000375A4BB|nr:BMP family ABC transporter substrate-binding protein [Desulfovibrio oxyclinae]
MLVLPLGCAEGPSEKREQKSSIAEERGVLFGMYLDASGLGDRGFLDMQYQGLVRGCQKHDARFVIEQRESDDGVEEALGSLEHLVAQGCRAVFCTSLVMREAMQIAARNHPDVLFVLMDTRLEDYLPNTASVTFRTGEASYLAGYIAAHMSDSIGIIGGTDVVPVREFVVGFREGIRAASEQTAIHERYIDDVDATGIVWNNPSAAAGIARAMSETHGVDLFFPVAGASALGVFNYIETTDKLAIGVDSDQDYLAKGQIITSVIKRMDVAVEDLVGEISAGRFENRDYAFDLSSGGVALSPMHHTRHMLPDGLHDEVDSLRKKIIDGTIQVPTAYR